MKKKRNRLKEWRNIIIMAILLSGISKVLFFECIQIQGNSMQPTLMDGERLIVNKFAYIISKPKSGDIVVFKCPYDKSHKMIKRTMVTEGNTTEIINGKLFINDEILREPYILEKMLGNFHKRIVPKNTIFVLGDNRNNSKDSRFKDVGFVSLDLVEGKGYFVIWPIKSFRKIR